MNPSFAGKVAVITGGAHGIGKAIAEAFRDEGAAVEIIDIAPGEHYVGDISKKETLEAFAQAVLDKHGHIDFLINNALPLMKGLDACTYEEFQYALAVGVTMMLPCFITGAYAFSTTRVSEFVCALRRMRVPESAAIPCLVVIRFFPTIGRDYRRTRDAMALRGLASGRLALLRYPAQSLEFVLVPLLMNTTIVSRDLSVAALTKGLGRFGRHTCITEIHSVGLIGRRWRSARSRWH